nr:DExH-box ATP-dependent RNA helicase DExH17 [Tanacetum cinerariifolium]
MILQMSGRAGRPPFDDTGTVIIMTRRETVHLFENVLGGCELVESQLLSCVTEHLAAESNSYIATKRLQEKTIFISPDHLVV